MAKKAPPAEEREAILEALALLSPPCEINKKPSNYFSLAIGTGRNKNAVIVPKRRNSVSFYLEDSSFVDKLTSAGLEVEKFAPDSKNLMDKDKYRVIALTVSEIAKNEVLIRDVLKHSFAVMERRRSN